MIAPAFGIGLPMARQLWMYALAAINHRLWHEAEPILEALEAVSEIEDDVALARAFMGWRKERSLECVRQLADGAANGQPMATLLLGYVHAESGLLTPALDCLLRAGQYGDAVVQTLTPLLETRVSEAMQSASTPQSTGHA